MTDAGPRRPSWTDALQVFALSGFAVAQPVFDILGRNATFFVAHRATGRDIALLVALLIFVPPLVAVVLERLVALVWLRAYAVVHAAGLAILAALTVAPAVGRSASLPPSGWGLVALVVFGVTWLAYVRWTIVRRVLVWAAIAPVVFLVAFATTGNVRSILFGSTVAAPSADVSSDTRIFFVLLDELPLASLMTPDGRIDGSRFPNFARLARISTWYPNATTVAESTEFAVPALLTGRLPSTLRLPDARGYPENLFTLLRDLRPRASEFVTRMCPVSVCPARPPSVGSLLFDVGTIYSHLVLPDAVSNRLLPSLQGRWAGFGGGPAPRVADANFGDLARVDMRQDEAGAVGPMVRRVPRTPSPGLWYLHVGLPHAPWRFLPDGRQYAGHEIVPGLAVGEGKPWGRDQRVVDGSLQRYLLQLRYVDSLLGSVLDAIDEVPAAERLLVVAADHGGSFRAGRLRRLVDGPNRPDILPVPLFVSYPGQREAAVDDRPAQTIDVLPTIADVAGFQIPWRHEGVSLRSSGPPVRERTWWSLVDQVKHELGPQPLDVTAVARRIRTLFGPGGGPDDLYAWGPHTALVGRRVDGLALREGASVTASVEDEAAFAAADVRGPVVPTYVRATLRGMGARPVPVAVALNGTVAGIGWTYEDEGSVRVAVLASPRYLDDGANDVALFVIDEDGALAPVRRG